MFQGVHSQRKAWRTPLFMTTNKIFLHLCSLSQITLAFLTFYMVDMCIIHTCVQSFSSSAAIKTNAIELFSKCDVLSLGLAILWPHLLSAISTALADTYMQAQIRKYVHAVSCRQVSVDESVLGQVLHPSGHVRTHFKQLHRSHALRGKIQIRVWTFQVECKA